MTVNLVEAANASLVFNVCEDSAIAAPWHAGLEFFPAVAQTVGFGLERSKMLYLSMRVD
jgi:hypothetical protein